MKKPKLLTRDEIVLGESYAYKTVLFPDKEDEENVNIISFVYICKEITEDEILLENKAGTIKKTINKKTFDEKQKSACEKISFPVYKYDTSKNAEENSTPWFEYLKEKTYEKVHTEYGTTKKEIIDTLIHKNLYGGYSEIHPFIQAYFKKIYNSLP